MEVAHLKLLVFGLEWAVCGVADVVAAFVVVLDELKVEIKAKMKGKLRFSLLESRKLDWRWLDWLFFRLGGCCCRVDCVNICLGVKAGLRLIISLILILCFSFFLILVGFFYELLILIYENKN